MEQKLTQQDVEQAVREAEQKSFVMIEFSATGAAEFVIYKRNVTPQQVLGALAILEIQVKNWWLQEENRRMEMEKEQKLVVPPSTIIRAK